MHVPIWEGKLAVRSKALEKFINFEAVILFQELNPRERTICDTVNSLHTRLSIFYNSEKVDTV